MSHKWDNYKYPKWFDKAWGECEYKFEYGFIPHTKIRNAFDDEYTKWKVYQFYRYLRGEIKRCPVPMEANNGDLHKMTNLATRNTHWINIKDTFCNILVYGMNSRYWSRFEYELLDKDSNGELVKLTTKSGKKMPYSGFYATPEDKEIRDAWDETFQWILGEPWINLPGRTWEHHRMEQI